MGLSKENREYDRYSFITNKVFDDNGNVVNEREFTFHTRCDETIEYLRWVFGWLTSRKDNQRLCVEVFNGENPTVEDWINVTKSNIVSLVSLYKEDEREQIISELKKFLKTMS